MVVSYQMRATAWRHPGPGGWVFVTLSKHAAAEIREMASGLRAWGSVPVAVTIGHTTCKTSVFPDKKSGSYLLPLKASVRRAEGVEPGRRVSFTLTIGGP